ncbi:MAG: hypothetical protein Ct9H300mP28_13600 [Pseudomonadota bacterium]|nr:MAG: hypothetical protein Ct9H300mP28_13600 [Pseudomonadota bacterium]
MNTLQDMKFCAAKFKKIEGFFKDQLLKIHLRRGAGAYICGEESAMIESIEGKRGIPVCDRLMLPKLDYSADPLWNTTWKLCTGLGI